MFIEANAEYTKEEPLCRENFVSCSGLKKITPTPEGLKLAMFRMSSRCIAKALK